MTAPDPNSMDRCELCQRLVSLVTKHHLIPRARHNKARTRREFDRKERHGRVAWLCRPCHDHVHALFEEKTLGAEFNTLETLAAHPEIVRFTQWIQTKPDGFKPQSHDARHRR